MQKVLTAAEMRQVDRQTVEKYGVPFLLLMENAAHAAANVIREKLGGSVAGKSFLILCGKGNNGGDGAALARILWAQGAKVEVNLFGNIDETKDEARVNFQIAKEIYEKDEQHQNQPKSRLWFFEYYGENWIDEISYSNQDVVVDAIFGTGLTRRVEGQLSETISRFVRNQQKQIPFFVSIDIPSGLNSDLSEKIGANIGADLTVTFTAPKPANVLPPVARFNGELVTVNIGSPQALVDKQPSQLFLAEKQDALNWLCETQFTADSYKKTRGHALVIAGSKNMSGAAVLCANAAMTSGVGLVTVATPEAAQNFVASRVLPEIIIAAQRQTENGAIAESALETVFDSSAKMDATVIGCGLSSNEQSTKNFVRQFVENRKTPIVIDADALNSLSPFDLCGSDELPLILTPHIGEMRRLIGADETIDLSDRVTLTRSFAQRHHVILVLKGERTLIAAPDGKVVVNPTGSAGLGKAGNGDTLAGIIGGFITQSLAIKKAADTPMTGKVIDIVFEAAVAALYIAGFAGEIAARKIGQRAMIASDVRECLSEAFRELKDE